MAGQSLQHPPRIGPAYKYWIPVDEACWLTLSWSRVTLTASGVSPSSLSACRCGSKATLTARAIPSAARAGAGASPEDIIQTFQKCHYTDARSPTVGCSTRSLPSVDEEDFCPANQTSVLIGGNFVNCYFTLMSARLMCYLSHIWS